MSSAKPVDPATPSGQSSKAKKKNKKKKGAIGKAEANGESLPSNGTSQPTNTEADDLDIDEEDDDSGALETSAEEMKEGGGKPINSALANASADDDWESRYIQSPARQVPSSSARSNGIQHHKEKSDASAPASAHDNKTKAEDVSQNPGNKLDALVKEREALTAEVIQLRKSLESIQEKHEQEITELQDRLEESQTAKEHADTQYRDLLGRVNTIRSQLGERLKSDAAELEQKQSRIEELEEQNQSISEANASLQADLSKLAAEREQQAREVNDLRSRQGVSQQNWIKERDELISREAYAREEFETAKQAMQDWEVLAMEERALRQNLSDRVAELEEQLSSQQEAYEKAAAERDTLSQTVDGLQRALRDIQDARKKELRELVENSQSQLDELRKQQQASEEAASAAQNELEATKKELERALPFEKEVKEKNLLIGKLRHEAVILNDHLTKALRFLRQRKPEDMVDRQLVTNHFLHFLTLDRTDPKKFQVLQLIAALLAWNDEQKEQAGLARPGASTSVTTPSLRVPMSPFRRTPSTPSLSTAAESSLEHRGSSASKESLAELWSDFLEREAREGTGGSSRKGSMSGRGSGPPSPSASRRESSTQP